MVGVLLVCNKHKFYLGKVFMLLLHDSVSLIGGLVTCFQLEDAALTEVQVITGLLVLNLPVAQVTRGSLDGQDVLTQLMGPLDQQFILLNLHIGY